VIAELCEVAGLEDAIVLGHSMGGAVAIDAATRTDRIAAVALVNSSGAKHHRGIFPRGYRVIERLVDLHPLSRRVTLAVAKPVARRIGFSKRLTDDEMIWAGRLCARFDPALLGEQLSSLDKPVLVAWSEDDPAVEREVSDGLLERARRVEERRFAKGGHNLQSSQACELADAIVAWEATIHEPLAAT
jgi:pimeloyl-ACP methyl ester carboxylesterase